MAFEKTTSDHFEYKSDFTQCIKPCYKKIIFKILKFYER